MHRYQQLSWVVGCLVVATNGLKFVWCVDCVSRMHFIQDLATLGFGPYKLQEFPRRNNKMGGGGRWVWNMGDSHIRYGPNIIIISQKKKLVKQPITFFFFKNHILICNLDGMSQDSIKSWMRGSLFICLLASFIPIRPKARYKFRTEDEHLNKFIHCFPGIQMLIITDNMDLHFTVFSCGT